MTGTLSLDSKALNAARNAARGGQYQLLLGAGASVGAHNSRGPIPLAKDLVEILKARYPAAPIDSTDALPRAYQRAIFVSSAESVWETFVEVFKNAHHQDWFTQLAGLPWRRVWTLNIDDAFENAYRGIARSDARKSRTVSWDDPYVETGDLEVIHLHGHVLDSKPRNLIFSLSEYQMMASIKPVWSQVLAGLIGVEPFIIMGASILGDPDVESLLLAHRPTAVAPSFVVDPYIGEGNRWELEQLGYSVVKLTGEQFLEAWQDEMGLDAESVRSLEESEALSVPQFVKLQSDRVAPPPRAHDYFGGDAPVWADVIEKRPALFPWVKEIIGSMEAWLNDGAQDPVLHVIYGARMSGVTSGLLLAALEFTHLHVDVFSFDKSSRFNVPAVLRARAGKRPAVIITDAGADFSNDVDRLLKEAAQSGVQLYMIVSESPHNDLRLEGRLGGGYRKSITKIPVRLNRNASTALVKKLDEFGRLGSLELEPTGRRIRHFQGRDVFSALMEVEHAIGFTRRLEGEVIALDSAWKKHLLLLLSIASQGARQVAVVDASIALGRASDSLTRSILDDDHMSAVTEIVDSRLLARQRDHAIKAIVRVIGADDALSATRSMVENLAPLATRTALQQRNLPVQLVGYLMTAKQLQRNFPGIDLDKQFYEPLRPLFGDWNGRYWEQRAIYSKSQGMWPTAESFAARAVGLYDDPYTRTTYGTILINKAANFAHPENSSWQEFYERGHSEFETAIHREPGNRVTVFAYLSATLELVRRLISWQEVGDLDVTNGPLLQIKGDWEARYNTLRLSLGGEQNFESARRAETMSREWQSLWVDGNSN
ncbi:SIR2 family protein [Streptomyces zhihengii]|uniref:P-loop NTPase n=1 Tax=Streptomyces zhihengii TaxID=1818004 RepID=UPI0034514851